jgi:hypothetical protein
MHGNAQLQFVANLDRDRLAVALQISPLRHHVQRVEKLSHEAELDFLLERA